MRARLASAVALGVVLLGASCGSDPRVTFEVDAGVDAGTDAGEGPRGGAFPDAADPVQGVSCSADLRDVLDASGGVVGTCPPDQGCSAGRCVPACEAAKENGSTIGCDYYVAHPDYLVTAQPACFAAFVVNTWDTPVTIGVERDGEVFPVDAMTRVPSGSGQSLTYAPLVGGKLPPGEVAIVFLSRRPGTTSSCPSDATPGFTKSPAQVAGTGRGHAFHLTTSAPVTAYDMFPYGGGNTAITSATLLLPTSAWGKNYVGVNAYRQSVIVPKARNFLQIVAQEDDTEVKILPTIDIEAGPNVAPTTANTTGVYTLRRGELLQLEPMGELTGSAISADKPIGVFGGASCLSIDVDKQACDAAHQQLPPVGALGSRYVGVRYRNRWDGFEEHPPWRLVGAADGTILTYEPSAPMGAPSSLGAGEVQEFAAAGPFVVRSQDDAHPFYMSAHMTGCEQAGGDWKTDCRGDPEFVNVVPAEQYLRSYVFFTDPTYSETNLVIVRQKTSGAFSDVTLDCAGPLDGWQPIDDAGEFEYTRFDLVRGNFEKQGSCDNGRHEIESDAPFGVTVWGWGSRATGGGTTGSGFHTQAVSYAYPAGARVKPVNTVVVSTDPH